MFLEDLHGFSCAASLSINLPLICTGRQQLFLVGAIKNCYISAAVM